MTLPLTIDTDRMVVTVEAVPGVDIEHAGDYGSRTPIRITRVTATFRWDGAAWHINGSIKLSGARVKKDGTLYDEVLGRHIYKQRDGWSVPWAADIEAALTPAFVPTFGTDQ